MLSLSVAAPIQNDKNISCFPCVLGGAAVYVVRHWANYQHREDRAHYSTTRMIQRGKGNRETLLDIMSKMLFTPTSLKGKCTCNLRSSERQFAFKPTINAMYLFVYFMTLNFIVQLWGFHQPPLLIAFFIKLNSNLEMFTIIHHLYK